MPKTATKTVGKGSSNAELLARIADLEAEAANGPALTLKVSEKGAISVYNLRRFPVTFYADEWDRLIVLGPKIKQFIKDNKDELTFKD